jgi:phospholipid/cholesterol/gamma-HCH transport system substrate-binding protein
VPVIPTKLGGLGQLINNAPLLLERLAGVTERISELLSDDNQKSIRNILANTDRLTGSMADASPELKPTIAELRQTLSQASTTLASFEKVAGSADRLLNEDVQATVRSLHTSLAAVQTAANQLDATLKDAQPAARQLSESTLPAAEAAIRDLRATSRALRDVTEKIDNQGAGALIGGPKLPEYKP